MILIYFLLSVVLLVISVINKNCLRLFYALVFVLLAGSLPAQIPKPRIQVKYPGPSAYSNRFSDVFSATSNQASLAQLEKASFGVYGEKRFMLKELSSFTSILAAPIKSGTIGFQGDYFGSATYNETQLGLIYARKLTSLFDIGVKFNYYSIRTAGYGTASAINIEAGAIFHINNQLHFGIHAYNPTNSSFGKNNIEKLGYTYKMGLGYEVSSTVFINAEIEKQESQMVNVNVGMQYNLHKKVFIRGGIATLNNNSYVAVCFKTAFARIDVTAAYHPQLGLTPGLLLLMDINKQNKD